MCFHSFIVMECVYIAIHYNSSVNAAQSSLNSIYWQKFHGKGIKLKTFLQGYVISLCGVVVRYSRIKPEVLGSSQSQYLIFFSIFLFIFSFFVLFLIKYNKQQEKYCVSREKIVHHILTTWINCLNFYHFLQFTVGKPELITKKDLRRSGMYQS